MRRKENQGTASWNTDIQEQRRRTVPKECEKEHTKKQGGPGDCKSLEPMKEIFQD